MKFNYKVCRITLYPHPYFIYESLSPFVSGGNDEKKAAIDAHINLVNSEIPEDSTEYTSEEIEAKLVELKKNSVFLSID